MYKRYIKRLLDIIIATVALIIFSPIFCIVTVLLLFINNGKPFFFQLRPGKNAKIFKILKFKTMTDKVGEDGKLLPDAERITIVGSFVRKTSLDEIPQLLNVIVGDMSLVGPRPLLIDYLSLYREEQSKRHLEKPGITGLAQVNGRNAISWKKKFEYDVEYVENISFRMDLKILMMTVIKVFKREGVNKENHATTEAFNGNN